MQRIKNVSARRIWTIGQHLVCTSNSTSNYGTVHGPSICVTPKIALYDEAIKINLRGLSPQEKVTLHGQSTSGATKKVLFGSCGHYIADTNGHIDLTVHPSLGGTYTGTEPMGLLWSMKPVLGENPFSRMAINFTETPSLVTLKAYSGHLNLDDIYEKSSVEIKILATTELERWFRSKEVRRIEIEEGNIRGALFLPPGDGPFQGVIDMFGSSGGLIEYRSALLASRGFVALSLAFMRYKDLPSDSMEFLTKLQNYDYFEEAVNWLSNHPKVCSNGIGVIGVSKGVEYVLSMSAFSSKVKAAVSINGLNAVSLGDLHYQGKVLLKGGGFEIHEDTPTPEGLNLKKSFLKDGDLIPIWKGKAKHLMLVSEDDCQCDTTGFDTLYNACPDEKKSDIEIIKYPGAGHLLEPPYTPLCRSSINKGFDTLMLWGGKSKEHAYAQENSWKKILQFLRSNIPQT